MNLDAMWTTLGGMQPFNQWCALWLGWGFVGVAAALVQGISEIVSTLIRVTIVTIRGWPPTHLDANGKWKSESKK